MGNVMMFGAGDYAMRVWPRPDQARCARAHGRRGGGCHSRAERPGRGRRGGRVASPPRARTCSLPSTPKGAWLASRSSPTSSCAPTRAPAPWCASGRRPCRDQRQHLCAAQPAQQQGGRRHRHLPGAGPNALAHLQAGARDHGAALAGLPGWRQVRHRLRPHPASCRPASRRWCRRWSKPCCWWCWW